MAPSAGPPYALLQSAHYLSVIHQGRNVAFPVEEKYIAIAEQELGVRFPPSFRSKMMEVNGGEVSLGEDYFELYPFYDTSDRKRLKRTCNSIVHETRKEREDYRMPENLVAIGNNGGGDLLVYKAEDLTGNEAPVYWLDHENGDINHAAESFSGLVG